MLKWTKPWNNGGLEIANYTTTLKAPYSLHTYVENREMLYLKLLYSHVHNLQIVATNCAGYSPSVNISIFRGNGGL